MSRDNELMWFLEGNRALPQEPSVAGRCVEAENPSTPLERLRQLALDPDPRVQIRVAARRGLPQDLVDTLSRMGWFVRRALEIAAYEQERDENEVCVDGFYMISPEAHRSWLATVKETIAAWKAGHLSPQAPLQALQEEGALPPKMVLRKGRLWLIVRQQFSARCVRELEIEFVVPEGHYRELECVGKA